MEKIELLAPAGSMESLIAAINKGADAIYLGGSKFSARAYASNFDNEQMEKAIDYAHSYGVTVYVTINTLIKENEFAEALEYIGELYEMGVDALIIQDVGILNKSKQLYPDFELHASTQLSIHNGEGALFFRDNGFLRIVLSRELTLKEIEHISKELGIETEIFVHGALCVSYSGQCLMSSLIGGRSGNRGRCAQSCRLPYTLIREKDKKEIKGYLLSPKDICTIEKVEDLINSGTSSLKVEGRMKRPEYVAGVIESYREAIDNVYKKRKVSQNKNKIKLMKLFNREGFSNAYLYKNIGKDMMAYETPRNTGIFIGEALKNREIILTEDIALKDGIRISDDGFTISKIILNNKEVEEAKKGDKVKIFPNRYKAHDKLYKASDIKLLNSLKTAYENPYEKKILLNSYLKFKVDEPCEITVEYNGNYYTKQGDLVQKAVNRPLSKERIEDNFKKSGDIAFKINNIEFVDFEDGFMSVSSINNLRREVLEEIRLYEINKFKRNKKIDFNNKLENTRKERDLPEFLITLNTQEQLKAALDNNINSIALDIFGKNEEQLNKKVLKNIKENNIDIYIKTPTIIKEEFEYICNIIEVNLNNICGIVTANAGIINRFKNKTKIIGDYKLNIFNSKALDFYNKHIEGSCLSIELNRKEIKGALKNKAEGVQFYLYGKPEVMVSEYCPIGSTFGGKTAIKNCDNQCVNNNFILRDRMNQDNVIKTDIFCRSHIYNTVPINIIYEIEDVKSLGIKSFRIDLIDENYKDASNIIKSVLSTTKMENKNFTKGHYRRGVE
ncbi:U32 family peptidase [Clostridium tarantellae]|uniref:U32 family peptidase n=1 Tax=Clostridium tarantellae TaxID=39493 RepID=A0A6I1MKQ4_9CLOT|nr:U32 family peptidase [Clostridium tarantellae]MPQ44106.1 U32 family peptidase [Clostridium tarantellae]